MAALTAPLPENCLRTVYLCDDGRDVGKKQFLESLERADVVYVTRPKPKHKQMNGKSENVNNCLRNVIYRGSKSLVGWEGRRWGSGSLSQERMPVWGAWLNKLFRE